MHHFNVDPERGFRVLSRTKKSEVATMVIDPGDSEGGPTNEHKADQWLFVLSGSGTAIVEGHSVSLSEGVLLEIEAGERHEIKNTGKALLKTMNFYAPVEY